jgi:GT2 family glycosyltransferase
MSAIVVVPSRYLSNLEVFLHSLTKTQPDSQVIVVVDSHSPFDVFVEKCKTIDLDIELVYGASGQFSFAKNANIGIKRALDRKAKCILLSNDDVKLVTENGVDKLVYELGDRQLYCGVFPVVIGAASVKPVTMMFNGIAKYKAATERKIKPWIGPRAFPFICVLLPRHAIEKVGFLDEDFTGGYGFEDQEWQERAFRKGFVNKYTPKIAVQHVEGLSSFRRRLDFGTLYRRHLEIYNRKKENAGTY